MLHPVTENTVTHILEISMAATKEINQEYTLVTSNLAVAKKAYMLIWQMEKFKKILVLTGAGISVSAGIPDFRSPGTGLYDNLKEYNLPRPEAIFSLDFFIDNPEPFYKFAQNFDLTRYEATPTHYFIKLLQDK